MPLRSFSAWPYFISERPSVTLRQSFGLEARPTTSLTLRFTSYPHPTLSFSSTLLWWWRTPLCDRRCPTRVLQVTACRDRAGLCVRRQGGDTPYDTHFTRLFLLTFATAPSPPTIPPYITVKSSATGHFPTTRDEPIVRFEASRFNAIVAGYIVRSLICRSTHALISYKQLH